MGKHTPCLDQQGKEEYIREHLYNELRWLLHAATEWQIQKHLQLNIVGYNVQVYAMDSAVLHARTLFEFFLNKTKSNYYGCTEYVSTELQSDSYKDWSGPLHSHLMHAQVRSRPKKLGTSDGPKDLNEMPVYFAQEILRLWKEFEAELSKSGNPEDQKLGQLARDKRKEAIDKALCVVNSAVAQQHAKEKRQILKPVFVFTN